MNAFPTLSKCGTLRVISDRTGLLSADETRQVLRGAPVLHHFDHLCLRRVDENREKKQAEGLITMDHMGSILIAAEYDHRNTAELFSSIRASSLYNCTIACAHTNSWTTTDTALFEALGCFLRHFPPIISARLEAAGYSRGTSFFGWRIPHQGIAGDLGPIDSITHPYRRTANLQFLLLSGEDIVAFSRLRFFRLLVDPPSHLSTWYQLGTNSLTLTHDFAPLLFFLLLMHFLTMQELQRDAARFQSSSVLWEVT
ncbi:hypothetical protein OF83DRAFT_485178 [Amylostereum chailletii]|nr:hypothetical protein OF83DRAFT_485178 [Amylostereum chailletii]